VVSRVRRNGMGFGKWMTDDGVVRQAGRKGRRRFFVRRHPRRRCGHPYCDCRSYRDHRAEFKREAKRELNG
jgi:hypothetical protein